MDGPYRVLSCSPQQCNYFCDLLRHRERVQGVSDTSVLCFCPGPGGEIIEMVSE
jgi:hypothetical protein